MPHRFLARYLGFSTLGHLLWETLQLPLYTIWKEAPAAAVAYAVAHCTVGDVLIALLVALVLLRSDMRPIAGHRNTAVVAILTGIAYTVGSEWFNTQVSFAWRYSDAMPTVGGIGISPLLQWVVVPSLAYWWVRVESDDGIAELR